MACEIAFVTPSIAEVPLTFGPADDQDGTPCGSNFTTNVVVSSSGDTVTLFVDGSPFTTEFVVGSSSSFDGVLLGSRSPATSTLRAMATMSDGRTCETTLGPVSVDCAGPTCTLTGPNTNPWLTSDDDLDSGTAGVQANFTLTTDAENDGTQARLILNGDTNNPLLATVQTDTATFSSVTLAEGLARTVQGECRDQSGNVTLSAIASWDVTLAECEVAFTSPVPGSGALTLGPGDDQDSEACGTDFTTTVDVTTNATRVILLVDAQPIDTLDVSGASVQFSNVILGTRTPATSSITVVATMADGRACTATRDNVIVDCEGPLCTLVATSNNPFFNIANDENLLTTGLQTTFRVDTNPENVDQDALLIIDGDDGLALTETFDANGPSASATFTPVTLDEGAVRTVQAECEDEVGNVTRSSLLTWAVDLTPCTIQIDSVANDADPITRAVDNIPGGDIQVDVVGRVTGTGCTGVRVGVCGQPLGSFNGLAIDVNGDWTLPATLVDVSGSGEICAEVQDGAQNVVEDRVPVEVRSNDPIVEVASPLEGASFNVLGTVGATADLNTSTAACDAEVVVNCTDVGAAVVLIVDGTPLVGAATCVTDINAVPPYAGTATFASVAFDALSDTHTIAAEQTVAGLVGNSAAITINTDCVAPVVAITDPLCAGQLHLIDDDEDGGLTGLQHTVNVSNGGVPQVSLNVVRTGGSEDIPATGDNVTTVFPEVNFGTLGDVTLTATATDPAGNLGTSGACVITVVIEPTVDILVPTAAQILSTADDCVPVGGGFGITVSGTTGAPAGSTVEVSIGAGLPVTIDPVVDGGASPNTFSGCVAIPQGQAQVITVTVTDSPNPAGSDTVTVSADTLAPTDPVTPPGVTVTNRREGQVTFTWPHVADTDGSTLAGYEMRCAATAITDETAWGTARQLTVNTVGAAVGSPDASELIPSPTCTGDFCRGFRVGATERCVIRGRDIAGQLTPLNGGSGSVDVNIPFVTTPFTTVSNGNSNFTNVVGVGDVNADGGQDMLYGVLNQPVQLFFGGTSSAAFDTTADVTFTGAAASGFGAVMASIGDVNGDTIADFAISSRAFNPGSAANSGKVFIFFGRAANTWPSAINLSTGCNADVCLTGSASGAFFGWEMSGTDFNGDGTSDVVISARAASSNVGAVYVLLGGTQFQVATGTNINVPSGNPNGFVITPPASRSFFGHGLASVGNGAIGDTHGDLAISALGVSAGNPGALFFLNGEDYPNGSSGLVTPSASPMIEVSTGSGADFGSPVRAIGDFDGDGLGDLALGRNFSAGSGLGSGEMYLRNANVPTFSSGPGFRLDFAATGVDNDYGTFIARGLYSHASLGSTGDLDGDGLTEFAVGSAAGGSGGILALFYGTTTPVARTRANADFSLTSSGTSLLAPNFIGDFDGDGFHDLAVVDGGSGTDRIILLR